MKKTFLILTGLLLLLFGAQAGHYKMIPFKELPSDARNFVNNNFPDLKISYTAKERDFLEVSYKVIFVDGNKLEFNRSGEWKEIDFSFSKIPESAVPKSIRDFIAQQHPEQTIIEIDKEKWNYEVKLNNDIELKFDKNQNFIGLDD